MLYGFVHQVTMTAANGAISTAHIDGYMYNAPRVPIYRCVDGHWIDI